MIIIKYTGIKDFEYDIQGLIRSFFPGADMATDKDIDYDIMLEVRIADESIELKLKERSDDIKLVKSAQIERENRKDTKNRLKRLVYDVFAEYTGKSLPWGTLSGIRPTKITTGLLKSGMSEEDVYAHIKKEYYISDEKAELSINISEQELKILKDIQYENGYSIYIGIPFCPSTCSYCSFTSYPLSRFKDKVDLYIDALCKEIEFVSERFKDKKLNTIYIGGGTPTTLEPQQMDRLLRKIEEKFEVGSLSEFTVEAGRPDSITGEKLEVIKKHGVTRISINPQTMNEKTLRLIGRRHNVEQVKTAFNLAREMGFDNINMDFIVGLPQETMDDVRYTMEETKKLMPDSVTVHSLAIKRAARMNTVKENFKDYSYVNNEDIMAMTRSYAREMGMQPYYLYRQKNMTGNMENVGYAVDKKAGIYNILIMEEKQTIVACGAGASTKRVWTEPDQDGTHRIERCENVKDVDTYIARIDEMIERKRKIFAEE